jgi:hypothetical protein
MPVSRARTTGDIRREIVAAEQRLADLVERWHTSGTTATLLSETPTREALDGVEEMLRHQRGTLDRLHQLWIEYAQAIGQHAPQ